MFTTTKEVLAFAENTSTAIAAFNCYNAETIQAAVKAAENQNQPVIIAYGERYKEYMNLEAFAAFTKAIAENATVDVALHLDHSYEFDTIRRAVHAGFTSVMFDGSALSLEENIKQTKEVVDFAHEHGVHVEAEIGSMQKGAFSDEEEGDGRLTDPDEAADFVKKTNVDFLAASIGTVHGMYDGDPEIRLDLLDALKERMDTPLVLHGGSGTPEKEVLQAIQKGIRKINVNTEISLTAVANMAETLSTKPKTHLSVVMENAQNAMISHMENVIKLYKS
ncbi:class II fructose-bisphosphate aldolase [Alkalihalobacillus sp. LMS6]|uniref:class II fructose-bisphosphate aldolase n=1 Tax=Alkalihalobacillus sp. LMS6 TaxID=2924034 RepID=UPI0020D11243|nr:class II fructose-bisphosphate aldolase [Alkalihalobacillus sp. LMS6]UTR05850.1 class II fructose-bisphosphate aldolase [Alkalihalobacillus sp. LMS6]